MAPKVAIQMPETAEQLKVVPIKDLEEAILKKLNNLGHQHDAIFTNLAEMARERDKAVADLNASHNRCSLWIRAFTILSAIMIVMTDCKLNH
jgi:hypothetical protein